MSASSHHFDMTFDFQDFCLVAEKRSRRGEDAICIPAHFRHRPISLSRTSNKFEVKAFARIQSVLNGQDNGTHHHHQHEHLTNRLHK